MYSSIVIIFEPLVECLLYPISGLEANPLKESAKCQKRTYDPPLPTSQEDSCPSTSVALQERITAFRGRHRDRAGLCRCHLRCPR